MPCPPTTLARYARNIREHPDAVDYWLDRWFDATTRATEWDAVHWGFDPIRWCLAERTQMACRARTRG